MKLRAGILVFSCVLGLSCDGDSEPESEPAKTVIRYRADADLRTLEAPVGGLWSLYAADETTPRLEVTVAPGTRVGFKRDQRTGELLAIAGDTTRVLPASDSGYYWTHE